MSRGAGVLILGRGVTIGLATLCLGVPVGLTVSLGFGATVELGTPLAFDLGGRGSITAPGTIAGGTTVVGTLGFALGTAHRSTAFQALPSGHLQKVWLGSAVLPSRHAVQRSGASAVVITLPRQIAPQRNLPSIVLTLLPDLQGSQRLSAFNAAAGPHSWH